MTRVMGVVNTTADSFSDGGLYLEAEPAIRHARSLVDAGADIVDVGGESTRPGAERVPGERERARVLPVLRALAGTVPLSIDTMSAETAEAAVVAGAGILNDVSGGLADPRMLGVAADAEVTLVLGHWRGHSVVMDGLARYDDTPAEVRDELSRRVDAALTAGVQEKDLVLDPGLGFSKRSSHNWELLRNLEVLAALGLPLLIGASRKRFLAPFAPADAPASARDAATAILTALLAERGVWGVRVHDVAASRTAVDVVAAWQEGSDV